MNAASRRGVRWIPTQNAERWGSCELVALGVGRGRPVCTPAASPPDGLAVAWRL